MPIPDLPPPGTTAQAEIQSGFKAKPSLGELRTQSVMIPASGDAKLLTPDHGYNNSGSPLKLESNGRWSVNLTKGEVGNHFRWDINAGSLGSAVTSAGAHGPPTRGGSGLSVQLRVFIP